MLQGYLLLTVACLLHPASAQLGPESCPDAANWERLAELIPTYYQCGNWTQTLESLQSKDNPNLHLAELGEFPSLVTVRTEMNLTDLEDKPSWTYQTCNGVLITNKHVLTAAHCLQEPPVPRRKLIDKIVRVVVGDYNTDITGRDCVSDKDNTICAPPVQVVLGHRTVSHEHFDRFSLHHDIAIIELEKKVTFSDYVQPICLPYGCNIEYTIEQIMIAGHYYHVGWQIYQPNRNSTFPTFTLQKLLRRMTWPDQGFYKCRDAYIWTDNRTQVCADMFPEDYEDPVNCDSVQGGPLILKSAAQQILVGISSYGESCMLGRTHKTGDPLVATWVPAYVRWILKTLYFLVEFNPYPYSFANIKWSTGVPGD